LWLTRWLFLKPVAYLQYYWFAGAINNIDFSSDTVALNLLLCLLLVLALLVVLVLDVFKIRSGGIVRLFKAVSPWYIAFILLKYGFDKVFKQQFYLPEPNILYSTFGSLTKDTLFWSTIGTSHSYNVVSGIIEVLTALLIMLRPTRVLGFCVATGVLVNIVLINFSFDISVKTFSVFLLAVVVLNVYPYLKTLYAFFVDHKKVQLSTPLQKPINQWVGIVAGIALVCYTLLPNVLTGTYNDDNTQRPPLHGAYQITRFLMGKDSLPAGNFPYKRVFVHRNNYLIFEQANGKMADYFFTLNPITQQLNLQDYSKNKVTVGYIYNLKTQILQLQFNNTQHWFIEAKALDWKALPALQNNWHFTVDGVK
jgi:hypothetical protein